MTTSKMAARNQLPLGYVIRPTNMDDAEAVCSLWEDVSQAKGYPEKRDPDEQRQDWQMPDFNLASSSIVVESGEGEIIGYAVLRDIWNPPVHPWLNWFIHPEHFTPRLAEFLVSWLEDTAQRVVDRCPEDAKIAFRMGSQPEYGRRIAIIADADYEHIRNFYRMLINMDEAPPSPVLPEGFSIRTYKHPDELDDMIQADRDGFQDHWGHVDTPYEEEREKWVHWLENDSLFDPSLFFLAIDDATGRIAGLCLCRIEQNSDPDVAYVDSLAVRREYRRRGIGLALLHHCFGVFWQRGRQAVALHVDASSLTGATRLYERAGMHVDQEWADYEKVIREGADLSVQAL